MENLIQKYRQKHRKVMSDFLKEQVQKFINCLDEIEKIFMNISHHSFLLNMRKTNDS